MQEVKEQKKIKEIFKDQIEKKIDNLMNNKISPENIFNFYDDFLNGLINISDEVLNKYIKQTRVPNKSDREKGLQEDEAFKYFSINSIGETIDSMSEIVEKREERLKEIINEISERSSIDRKIFVPPTKEDKFLVMPGKSEWKESGYVSRLLTLIYILENDLDLKLKDNKDITINQGVNSKEMIRKESYIRVCIPELNRIIYICNEEGNASFVFDEKIVKENNISVIDLDAYSKINFNDLIEKNKDIGIKIIQSKHWRERMLTALTKKISEFEKQKSEMKPDLEGKEKVPLKKEGWESAFSLFKITNLKQNWIEDFVEKYRINHSEWFEIQRVRGYAVEHYSPDLISIIKKYQEDNRGKFTSDLKLKGWKEQTFIYKKLKLQYRSFNRLAEKYRIDNPDWFETPIDSKIELYSEDFLKKITEDVNAQKDYVLKFPFNKSGWNRPQFLAGKTGEFGNTIIDLANKLGANNPEWFEKQYFFSANDLKHKNPLLGIFYHPDLSKKIEDYIKDKNLKMENIPETKNGWINAYNLSKILEKYKVSVERIKKFAENYRSTHLEWFEDQKKPVLKKGKKIYVNYSEHYHPDLVRLIEEQFIKK
ncbi:MAG: hypothetical protein WCO35_00670 [Candidatus Nomurabacteria bacterium]